MNNWSSIYHVPPRRNIYKYMVLPQDGRSSPPPNRSQPRKRDNTALQSHVAFFDTDGDGVIWPSDTFLGLRVLGLGVFFSVFAMLLIHGSLSWVTSGALLPDPFFRLRIENMHRGKHGSDSEAYTSTGAFDEDRFNYVFDMYSAEPHTHMTFGEGINMLHGNRNAFDPVSRTLMTPPQVCE
ncbi:hypothetical protein H2248_000200 [Termitomyces sp. 'cryptogamus']|nr:hypothetical protein H2248_000200 [Termitomyces sp. 'cryptogamus']